MFKIPDGYKCDSKSFKKLINLAFYGDLEKSKNGDQVDNQLNFFHKNIKGLEHEIYDVFLKSKDKKVFEEFCHEYSIDKGNNWSKEGFSEKQIDDLLEDKDRAGFISFWLLGDVRLKFTKNQIERVFLDGSAAQIMSISNRKDFIPTVEQFKVGIFNMDMNVSALFHSRNDFDVEWKTHQFKQKMIENYEVVKKESNKLL